MLERNLVMALAGYWTARLKWADRRAKPVERGRVNALSVELHALMSMRDKIDDAIPSQTGDPTGPEPVQMTCVIDFDLAEVISESLDINSSRRELLIPTQSKGNKRRWWWRFRRDCDPVLLRELATGEDSCLNEARMILLRQHIDAGCEYCADDLERAMKIHPALS